MRDDRLTPTFPVGVEIEPAPADTAQLARDVHEYLTMQPRQLPSRYLYDELGSALFEAICRLPWYGVRRAELKLLERHAHEIASLAGRASRIVELGCGSGEKLATLIERGRHGAESEPLQVHLIDVSAGALALSSRMVSSLPDVWVVTHQTSYEAGLREIGADPEASQPTLALFLGSNIGNFAPDGSDSAPAFLRAIANALSAGDAFLIGADLVKSERELLLAYDDPLGVTAAFNRNLLVRLKRELGAGLDVSAFAHEARWRARQRRVEMHLVSTRDQHVSIPAADLEIDFARGESIWTESSYKYEAAQVMAMLEDAGFELVRQWVETDYGFALTLARAL
jgi:dimethylhistidine N-methyltransferase